MPGQDTTGTTGTQEILSVYQEKLLHCVGDRALEEVGQRSCTVLGDGQKLYGHGLGRPVQGGPV